jgi:hypothetical protein
MAFRIPGRKESIRVFDRVKCLDTQYDVFDVGVQHADGGIDSVVVGVSAYSLKKAIAALNSKADAKEAEAPATV